MENKTQKQIVDLFSLFEDFDIESRSRVKECQKLVEVLLKLRKRYDNVKSANLIRTPLAEFDGLKGKLLLHLHFQILDVVKEIKEHLDVLKDLQNKLERKKNTLDESCKLIDFESRSKLITGTSVQPPLTKIIEYSENIVNYANHLCSKVHLICDYTSLTQADSSEIAQYLKIDEKIKKKVNYILAITAFTKDNEI